MGISAELQVHLDEGTTQLCRCWVVRRRDGRVFGFTDHDRNLDFDGVSFRADTGLTAQALQQTTGLSVDNSEAMGALSDAAITEADLAAGRYDGAAVEAWLVNWADPNMRSLRFRGTIGEVQAGGGAFRAELRGLTESLNQPSGRVYQKLCSALLGDGHCNVDLNDPRYTAVATVNEILSPRLLTVAGLDGYVVNWFLRGRLDVLSGAAAGLSGAIKFDSRDVGQSRITLWEELRAPVQVGDTVRLTAGCDRRLETCRDKFGNLLSFRGFPHIPGEDWLMTYPTSGSRNDGGSRNR